MIMIMLGSASYSLIERRPDGLMAYTQDSDLGWIILKPNYKKHLLNHGLGAAHVSGLNFACQLTSNAGGRLL